MGGGGDDSPVAGEDKFKKFVADREDAGEGEDDDDDREKAGKKSKASRRSRRKRRYRRKDAEDGAVSDSESYTDDSDYSEYRRRHRRSESETSLSGMSSRRGSGSDEDETEKYRLSPAVDSGDEERVERLRKDRQKRMAEIREAKRKRKPAEEISDGEVDSEGEQVLPVNKDPGEKIDEVGKGDDKAKEDSAKKDTPNQDREKHDSPDSKSSADQNVTGAESRVSTQEKSVKATEIEEAEVAGDRPMEAKGQGTQSSDSTEKPGERSAESAETPMEVDDASRASAVTSADGDEKPKVESEAEKKARNEKNELLLAVQRRAFLQSKAPEQPLQIRRESEDDTDEENLDGLETA